MKKKQSNPKSEPVEASEPRDAGISEAPGDRGIMGRLSSEFPIEDLVKAFVYLAGENFYNRLKNIDNEIAKLDKEINDITRKIAELEGEIRKHKKLLEERQKIRSILQAIRVSYGGASVKAA